MEDLKVGNKKWRPTSSTVSKVEAERVEDLLKVGGRGERRAGERRAGEGSTVSKVEAERVEDLKVGGRGERKCAAWCVLSTVVAGSRTH